MKCLKKSSVRERILAFVLSNNKSCHHGNGRIATRKRRDKPYKRKRQNHLKLSRHLFKVSKFHILLHLIQAFTNQIIYFYRRLNMPDSTCHNCGFDQLRVLQRSMRAQRAAAYSKKSKNQIKSNKLFFQRV